MQIFGTAGALALAETAAAFDPSKPFANVGDAVTYGLQFSVFGLVVVFGVLVLLWGILEVFHLVFSGTNKVKKSEAKSTEKSSVEEETAAAIAAAIAAANDDSELVAAITAAVHAYRTSCGEVGGFRVVSFKRR